MLLIFHAVIFWFCFFFSLLTLLLILQILLFIHTWRNQSVSVMRRICFHRAICRLWTEVSNSSYKQINQLCQDSFFCNCYYCLCVSSFILIFFSTYRTHFWSSKSSGNIQHNETRKQWSWFRTHSNVVKCRVMPLKSAMENRYKCQGRQTPLLLISPEQAMQK